MRSTIVDELKAIREKYADPRRTQIIQMDEGETAVDLVTTSDVMPEEYVWIAISQDNHIARTSNDKTFRQWGVDAPKLVLRTTTHQTVFLVAENGESAALSVHALPIADEAQKGLPVAAISPFEAGVDIRALFSLPDDLSEEDGFIISVSQKGMVKRSLLSDLPGPSANLFTLVKINGDDALASILFTIGEEEIILATRDGMGIRFSEEDVRPMGLVAAGVGGIKLRDDDQVIGAGVASGKGEVLLVTNRGKAKRMELAEFPTQGRYGFGVITWKLPAGEVVIGMMVGLLTHNGVLHFKEAASRLVHVTDAPSRRRTQAGKKIIDVKKDDEILTMSIPLDVMDRPD
jgi:DNA gyrase subunit A